MEEGSAAVWFGLVFAFPGVIDEECGGLDWCRLGIGGRVRMGGGLVLSAYCVLSVQASREREMETGKAGSVGFFFGWKVRSRRIEVSLL